MECVPIARPLVVRLAALPLTLTLPSVVAPSLKVTVPVVWPPYRGVIVAVKVTASPSGGAPMLAVTVAVKITT